MARAPDERIEQAKVMYLSGQKLVQIASQLNLPEGTVRRWKCTYKWDSERSEKNNGRSEKKANVRNEKKKMVSKEVKQVMENPDLTDKQRLFCLYYVRCFNATKAYQKAYEVDYNTAASIGYRLLENDGVREEVNRLKQNRMNRELLDESDIFQRYMDIAFADMTDFVEFGREKVPVMSMYGPVEIKDPGTGAQVPLMKEINSVRFRESSKVDGTLITEVKQGKDGASIKRADPMKALEWLTDHMNMATEEQKARISALKAKVEDKSDKPIRITFTKASESHG